MELIKGGSVLTPPGFLAGVGRCGLKDSGDPDIALLVGEEECTCGGVFTQNLFAAPPVKWCRSVIPADHLRAIAVNSGNANACTGAQGERDAARMARELSNLLECRPEQVGVASTGIIGRKLPMDRIEVGLKEAFDSLSSDAEVAGDAARAILTTDTRPKTAAVKFPCGGREVAIGGMAKGSGMIAPNMATMLAFITTDIGADCGKLQKCLAEQTQKTFNRISVDGDTSTNDSVFAAASGASGVKLEEHGVSKLFSEALYVVMDELARQVVADGEGAEKVIEVKVRGGASPSDVDRVGKAVANSLLVKCAIHGEDPNWGRILCAAGYSGAEFRTEEVDLWLGETRVVKNGLPTGADAGEELKGEEVKIVLDLGAGEEEATFRTCDMSKEYVDINAHYHT